jgi:hypothetical protein
MGPRQRRPVYATARTSRRGPIDGVRPGERHVANEICLSHMVEPHTDEAQDPGPQGWCVCGQKVTIADPREVTLPNGRPGWEGHCPECGSPLFAIRRKGASS